MEWEQVLLSDISIWMCPSANFFCWFCHIHGGIVWTTIVLCCSDLNCVGHGAHFLLQVQYTQCFETCSTFSGYVLYWSVFLSLNKNNTPQIQFSTSSCYIVTAKNVTSFILCTKWCPGNFIGQTKQWLHTRINSHKQLVKDKHIHCWFTSDLSSLVLKTLSANNLRN